MNLIAQIYCHHEQNQVPQTVADTRGGIDGTDKVKPLVMDDGCRDHSIAQEFGVDATIRNKRCVDLARIGREGMDALLRCPLA